MKIRETIVWTTLLLLAVSPGWGQEDLPHVGYVYPAGGRQGATFRVLLGGQNLAGAGRAHVSGGGVWARVVEYVRPLNQGQFKELQNRMGELTKKKQAAAPDGWRRGRRGGSRTFTNANWTAGDEKQLAEMKERLSTFAIRRTSVPALVETVALEVTVAPDAAPGKRELRLQTENGLSNPLVFCVGQLPEFAEESARSVAKTESRKRGGRGRKRQRDARPAPGTSPTKMEPEAETDVRIPIILNGQILPGDVDRYRFEARKGQDVVVDVSARKLIPYLSDAVPGWFQAAVALYDAEGKELAYDDDFRFHPDPALHCEIPADGVYVVEIRDALYRGREDFVYRVAIGELPFVTGVFPMGRRAGDDSAVELSGWNLSETRVTPAFQAPGTHWLAGRTGELVSNRVPFEVDALPECLDAEPNDAPDAAQSLAFPTIVNGCVDRPGDVDVFCFTAAPGARIVAEVKARRLGSSLDSALTLTDANGARLAFNDDHEDKTAGLTTHHADSRLSVAIPEGGRYFLRLEDTQRGGGPEHVYRLRLAAEAPDFNLLVTPSSVNARAGTNTPITVHALRKGGFDGPIALSLKDAPKGFALSGASVSAGQEIARLTLAVPAAPVEEPVVLALEGRAAAGGREIVRAVAPANEVTQAFAYRHFVPSQSLQVAVLGPARDLDLRFLGEGPLKVPVGGSVRAPIEAPRRSFFGAIRFELSDPPEGVSIEDVSLGRRTKELVLRCDAATAKPGLKGNLIVNVYAVKTRKDSGKGKEQRKKRRILLSALPAIPFEIVEE